MVLLNKSVIGVGHISHYRRIKPDFSCLSLVASPSTKRIVMPHRICYRLVLFMDNELTFISLLRSLAMAH